MNKKFEYWNPRLKSMDELDILEFLVETARELRGLIEESNRVGGEIKTFDTCDKLRLVIAEIEANV